MSRKTKQTYNALFMYIKTIEPTRQPQTIMMDFERASINAIRTRIAGCWFHTNQSLWRKIQELGKIYYYVDTSKLKQIKNTN